MPADKRQEPPAVAEKRWKHRPCLHRYLWQDFGVVVGLGGKRKLPGMASFGGGLLCSTSFLFWYSGKWIKTSCFGVTVVGLCRRVSETFGIH